MSMRNPTWKSEAKQRTKESRKAKTYCKSKKQIEGFVRCVAKMLKKRSR